MRALAPGRRIQPLDQTFYTRTTVVSSPSLLIADGFEASPVAERASLPDYN